MSAAIDSRAAAARCIAAVARGQSLNQALAEALPAVVPRDRGLLQELAYGSLRWWHQLAPLCDGLLERPLKSRDSDLRALLVLGAYQLLHMGLPAHAAVDSAVRATRALDKPWARGLINGVLRRLQREHPARLASLPEAARQAHPPWLWQELVKAWGREQAELLCAANNHRPPMTLRVNLRRSRREDYQERLLQAGIEATPCASVAEGLQLARPVPVEQLPGFADGEVSVQDEAAQRVAHLLSLQPGMRVLDACAAPGGKAAHLLEREPELALTALDVDAQRLQRVADTLQRLTQSARLVAADAADPDAWWDGQPFDAILVDAPCSGTGVIRRHPDIKLLRQASDIDAMAQRQLALLQALWPLLRPGGQLLYTTCSILPRENQGVAQAWAHQAGASAQAWPLGQNRADGASAWGLPQHPGYQQLPTQGGPDGFYYARWRRASQ